MKTPISIGLLLIVAVALFFSPELRAQSPYVFTKLNLMGTTDGGYASVSGGNVMVTYYDTNKDPTSFLYSGGRYTLIDDILVGTRTMAMGISGNTIVGSVEDNAKVGHGFIYNTSTGIYTTLTFPGATHTEAISISGSNAVGTYEDSADLGHGFLYNNGVYTDLSYPLAYKTAVSAVSGNIVAGTYEDTGNRLHGFMYNISTQVYSPVFYPTSVQTGAGAVDGNNVLGIFQQTTSKVGTGYIYNGSTYTPVTYPGSSETVLAGLSGNTAVGSYFNSNNPSKPTGYLNFISTITHGFAYSVSGNTYTSFDVPGSQRTVVTGISGNTIVGVYEDLNFVYHAFIANPATRSIALGGSLAFGNVTVNTTAAGTLTITNTGNAPVTVSSIVYPTGYSGSFAGSIAPGSVETVPVSFTPTSTTTYNGNIVVTSTATGSPSSIAVTGAGTAAVAAVISVVQPATTSYSDWSTAFAVVTPPAATPLNDGVPNLLKYLYGIAPNQAMSAVDRAALPTVGTTTTGGAQFLTLTYRQSTQATGLNVQVQTSTDLQNWSAASNATMTQMGTDATTGYPIMRAQVPVTGTQQFIRMNVTSP